MYRAKNIRMYLSRLHEALVFIGPNHKLMKPLFSTCSIPIGRSYAKMIKFTSKCTYLRHKNLEIFTNIEVFS